MTITALDTHLETAYRLLSACLYQPSPAWVEENVFGNLQSALEVVAPEIAGKPREMETALESTGDEELSVAYARLFVGPGSLGAIPYGSCYLEAEKQVMGGTTLAAREFYADAGLVLDQGFEELPDHMAVELEFLSYLLQRAIAAATEGDQSACAHWADLRREFLRRFVSGWYRPFCEAIRSSEENSFYRALADCLEKVVERDLAVVGLRGTSS